MKTFCTLLNPGPVNVSPGVRQALLGPDICHREQEYSVLQSHIRAQLLSVFDIVPTDYAAILLTGSGTAMVEAAVASCVAPRGRLLVIRNGVYGDRIADMARAHQIVHDTLDADWLDPVPLSDLEDRLKTGRYTVLAVVHHETTTGRINPVEKIAELAARARVKLLVDSVSGLGGEPLDFPKLGESLVVGTANKCFQGMPGLSFCIVRRSWLQEMSAYAPRTVYLHLPTHFIEQEKNGTAFTPAIQSAYALDAALAELAHETVAGRIERYRQASALLREGMAKLHINLLIPPEGRSNTITAAHLPKDMSYDHLHDALKDDGFVIYAGQGRLARGIFRVANMGAVPLSEYQRFIASLKRILSS